ncbi:hypothetical protein AVEN_113534-1, partial [Araneus ventricosus]
LAWDGPSECFPFVWRRRGTGTFFNLSVKLPEKPWVDLTLARVFVSGRLRFAGVGNKERERRHTFISTKLENCIKFWTKCVSGFYVCWFEYPSVYQRVKDPAPCINEICNVVLSPKFPLVWPGSLDRGVPAQVPSSASDHCSKLRDPFQNSPCVASERDFNPMSPIPPQTTRSIEPGLDGFGRLDEFFLGKM